MRQHGGDLGQGHAKNAAAAIDGRGLLFRLGSW
jgi:hypothetical protein